MIGQTRDKSRRWRSPNTATKNNTPSHATPAKASWGVVKPLIVGRLCETSTAL